MLMQLFFPLIFFHSHFFLHKRAIDGGSVQFSCDKKSWIVADVDAMHSGVGVDLLHFALENESFFFVFHGEVERRLTWIIGRSISSVRITFAECFRSLWAATNDCGEVKQRRRERKWWFIESFILKTICN